MSILDRRIGRIILIAKPVAVVRAVEQGIIRWSSPKKSPIAVRYSRRGAIRFRESKEVKEKRAQDGKRDEDEAEGLFGTVDWCQWS